MDIPDVLTRFVPKFDTLFLSVNETETAALKQTDHPLGWLLTVLQKENADKETLSTALLEVGSYLEALDETKAPQRRKAFAYLVLLILHRRPAEEHQELITLIEQHAHDMEVENMAQSIIEITKEQGKEQGIEQGIEQAKREYIIKLLQIKFDTLPESITKKINGIQDLSRLNSLFEKAATIDTLDDFDE